MGLLGDIWSGIKAVGKAALKTFNPFKDDEYRKASREEQDRFQERIEVIANDKDLDHEYRMEAQRVLAKIESYRHAEELARIEGTTKITIAQIEATKDFMISKVDLLKEELKRISNKEVALINAMGSNAQLTDVFLERLDKVGEEVKTVNDRVDLYSSEVSNLTLQVKSSHKVSLLGEEAKTSEKSKAEEIQEWTESLFKWADENNVPESRLPRNRKDLLSLEVLMVENISNLPKQIGNMTNLLKIEIGAHTLLEIPREIGKLVNLRTLSLIEGEILSIPKEVCDLPNLEFLNLDNNLISEIPADIGRLKNLQELSVAKNKLKSIPSEIGELINLKSLYLPDNDLESLPHELDNLINLESFIYDWDYIVDSLERTLTISDELQDRLNKGYEKRAQELKDYWSDPTGKFLY